MQTAKQGLELLEAAPEAFDLILKQHDPKHRIDAARMMSRLRSSNSTSLRSLPVAGKENTAACGHWKWSSVRSIESTPSCTGKVLLYGVGGLGAFAVTSTCDEREAVLQCLRMGAADYLIHPLRINELLVLGTRICHSKQVNQVLATVPLLRMLLHLFQRTSLMRLNGSSCVAILGWCFVTIPQLSYLSREQQLG